MERQSIHRDSDENSQRILVAVEEWGAAAVTELVVRLSDVLSS